MNVFLAYLLDEYESAAKRVGEYHSAVLRCSTDGDSLTAERFARCESASRVRRTAFCDAIQNFLDLSGELDPDDVAAAEKALADF